jgi:uncharacterized lipoprotein YmbA
MSLPPYRLHGLQRYRLLLLGSLVALIAACSSARPLDTSYYRLTPEHLATGAAATPRPTVVLEKVSLAQFLRQTGMVLQTGSHEIQISKTHLWAETLEQALPRALAIALRQHSGEYDFLIANTDYVAGADRRIRVSFDSFHANTNGEVTAAGHFQIIDGGNQQTAAPTHDFRFTETLTEDGYSQVVDRLLDTLDELATLIVQDLASFR